MKQELSPNNPVGHYVHDDDRDDDESAAGEVSEKFVGDAVGARQDPGRGAEGGEDVGLRGLERLFLVVFVGEFL